LLLISVASNNKSMFAADLCCVKQQEHACC